MKHNRYFTYVILGLCVCLFEYHTDLNIYGSITLMILCVILVDNFYENKYKTIKAKEYNDLQAAVRTTVKDAHLKYKQLMSVVSSIPFPILLIDQFGNIVMHNQIDVLCATSFEEENLTYRHNPFLANVHEFIKDAYIFERPCDKVLSLRGIEFRAISVPIMAKKKYSGCLVYIQDISKTLEGEKMQKRFIADASHELKTPISVLKGMIEILNRDDFNDPELEKEFLSQMNKEILRLEKLVKDLLQLSRLSMSNVVIQRKLCDVCGLFDKAYQSLYKKAEDKGLSIKKDYQTLEYAFCDPDKILQVMTNLLSNAIKYSERGTITLRTRLIEPYYVIEVEDEGCGISSADQEKIFDRFYRVHDDRSRKSGGYGLGLSIVQSIVEAHDGTIEVESKEGQGTLFRIKLKN